MGATTKQGGPEGRETSLTAARGDDARSFDRRAWEGERGCTMWEDGRSGARHLQQVEVGGEPSALHVEDEGLAEPESKAELLVITSFGETVQEYESRGSEAIDILEKRTLAEVRRLLATYFAEADVDEATDTQRAGVDDQGRLVVETTAVLPMSYESAVESPLVNQAIRELRRANYQWNVLGGTATAENTAILLIEGEDVMQSIGGGVEGENGESSSDVPDEDDRPTLELPRSELFEEEQPIFVQAKDCQSLAEALVSNATDIVLTENIELDCGRLPQINKTVSIITDCSERQRCALHALEEGNIFQVVESGLLELKNLAMVGGSTNGGDGGGAVSIRGGGAVFIDCFFFQNTAMNGGAVSMNGGRATFIRCIFNENKSDFGGAVGIFQSAAFFDSCTFSNNAADLGVLDGGYGGAVDLFDAPSVTFRDCSFTGNYASRDGGAVTVYERTDASFERCTFSTNVAEFISGGVSVVAARVHFDDCNFGAQQGGGGTDVHAAESQVSYCQMSSRMNVGGDLFFCCCGGECSGGISTRRDVPAVLVPGP